MLFPRKNLMRHVTGTVSANYQVSLLSTQVQRDSDKAPRKTQIFPSEGLKEKPQDKGIGANTDQFLL